MREKVLKKYAEPPPAAGHRARSGQKAERKAERRRGRGRRRRPARPPARRARPKPSRRRRPRAPLSRPREEGRLHFPPFNLLEPGKPAEKIDKDELYDKKRRIEEKLKEFSIEGEVREYHPGPVITTYEFYPSPGIKVAQVANLTEDLSLALEAESVRIQSIPGKSSLGVEIPNNKREIIRLRDIIESEKFQESPSKLTFALGKNVHGEIKITDLAVMPHCSSPARPGPEKASPSTPSSPASSTRRPPRRSSSSSSTPSGSSSRSTKTSPTSSARSSTTPKRPASSSWTWSGRWRSASRSCSSTRSATSTSTTRDRSKS